eukprot:9134676-Pyramimonas_sp.AAC.1
MACGTRLEFVPVLRRCRASLTSARNWPVWFHTTARTRPYRFRIGMAFDTCRLCDPGWGSLSACSLPRSP